MGAGTGQAIITVRYLQDNDMLCMYGWMDELQSANKIDGQGLVISGSKHWMMITPGSMCVCVPVFPCSCVPVYVCMCMCSV